MKYLFICLVIFAVVVSVFIFQNKLSATTEPKSSNPPVNSKKLPDYPLSIDYMRSKSYLVSDIIIEETLPSGSNYSRYIASYKSDGLKIFALLTVPQGDLPKSGWPVIIFNHGYIPPEVYKTTERYIAYVDAFARNGYIVFKPDYRGNGQSEGQPEGAYYSPAYAIDDLNAIASIKKYKDVNPNKIGVWGHSMGGNITLRDMVVDPKDIKAAVIWGGVVGSYNDLMNNWQRKVSYQPSQREMGLRNRYRQNLTTQFGTPQSNPDFWNLIDPTMHIQEISTPLQLQHSVTDEEVPVTFSQSLYEKMKKAGKTVEIYTYEGDDHNIANNLNIALQRSVDFFDKYLK